MRSQLNIPFPLFLFPTLSYSLYSREFLAFLLTVRRFGKRAESVRTTMSSRQNVRNLATPAILLSTTRNENTARFLRPSMTLLRGRRFVCNNAVAWEWSRRFSLCPKRSAAARATNELVRSRTKFSCSIGTRFLSALRIIERAADTSRPNARVLAYLLLDRIVNNFQHARGREIIYFSSRCNFFFCKRDR